MGTTAADASGAGHTGTLVNGPLWVASQATYGQAVSFDGSNDAVSIANPATYNFGTADFTIEFWIKRNTLGGRPTPSLQQVCGDDVGRGLQRTLLHGQQSVGVRLVQYRRHRLPAPLPTRTGTILP